ncbi:MAG: 1-acyl-sn-glycerol-3-phosphate acyltransferase [Gammaproteobacteria bacterium]|nr:1-acyl-sn-glycerol-3-phosphate acyltransferase [Gammaproteobacteria bacterium]
MNFEGLPVRRQSKPEMYIRASIFWFFHVFFLIPVVALVLLAYPFSVHVRYAIGSSWAKINMSLLRYICNLSYRVEGLENLPEGAAIVLSNHQSTYETLAFQKILPPQLWVLKRELLRVPVFGWGLALVDPIAIDRSAGRKAIDQMVEQGEQKLAEGRWVIIFPEGTRIKPGVKQRFKMGGSIMASRLDYPVIPIAHNAGEYWPRHSFIKWPGTVTIAIGPAIRAYGRDPDEVNMEVESWIRNKLEEISDPQNWNR